ncbi:40S ribosomal protein SA [Frankliniella fusca]|uniref:40S ribosomal protein SA n=1 Tax=Frankliniella fusca TaxID=407009 RepID=A0AAE1GWZ9_9NEOP|nr:40S ribosomal protein SA [Frankliniella fusca]
MENRNLEATYGEGLLYLLSYIPLCVAWSTVSMTSLAFQNISTVDPLDCSGTIVAAVPWAPEKEVYIYNLVLKGKTGTPPVTVAELISNSRNTTTIHMWLSKTCYRFLEVTSSNVWPLKIMVTDMSWAMRNAVIRALCGMATVTDYLEACLKAKKKGKVSFVLLVWCYCHLVYAIAQKVKKWLPLKSKKYSPARCFVRMVVAHMSRTTTTEAAKEIFKNFSRVVLRKKSCPKVIEALQWLNVRPMMETFAFHFELAVMHYNVLKSCWLFEMFLNGIEKYKKFTTVPLHLDTFWTEDEAEEILKPKDDDPDLSPDDTYKKKNASYQSSPFYEVFKMTADQVREEIKFDVTGDETLKDNPYHIPTIIDYLLKYYLPFYPLWSKYMQCLLINTENPLTNAHAELGCKEVKEELLKKKKHLKAPRYFKRYVIDTEKRVLEYKYPANCHRIKRRKLEEDSCKKVKDNMER